MPQTYDSFFKLYKLIFKVSFVNIDTPKSDEVATGNIKEIACLIQFILGAAVNCDNKNDFIGSLMTLDEYVQGELMAYIQIILDSCVPVGEESSNMDEEDLRQRLFELEKVCFLIIFLHLIYFRNSRWAPRKTQRCGQILNRQRTSFRMDKTASQMAK